MLTALSTSLLQPGLGVEEGGWGHHRTGAEEAGGGKEACRGRESWFRLGQS